MKVDKDLADLVLRDIASQNIFRLREWLELRNSGQGRGTSIDRILQSLLFESARGGTLLLTAFLLKVPDLPNKSIQIKDGSAVSHGVSKDVLLTYVYGGQKRYELLQYLTERSRM